jgi:hypothetical protein
MHVKCSPEVSRGDSRHFIVVVELAVEHNLVPSVLKMGVPLDTTLLVVECLSLHRRVCLFMLLVLNRSSICDSTTQRCLSLTCRPFTRHPVIHKVFHVYVCGVWWCMQQTLNPRPMIAPHEYAGSECMP